MKRKKERKKERKKGISVYVVMHKENPIYSSRIVNVYISLYVIYINMLKSIYEF